MAVSSANNLTLVLTCSGRSFIVHYKKNGQWYGLRYGISSIIWFWLSKYEVCVIFSDDKIKAQDNIDNKQHLYPVLYIEHM